MTWIIANGLQLWERHSPGLCKVSFDTSDLNSRHESQSTRLPLALKHWPVVGNRLLARRVSLCRRGNRWDESGWDKCTATKRNAYGPFVQKGYSKEFLI